LTYLLKDSLGGNSKTTLIATIRPGAAFVDETLVTLAYASQARKIVNSVKINENPFVTTIKSVIRISCRTIWPCGK
jgi:kinesin family protein 14